MLNNFNPTVRDYPRVALEVMLTTGDAQFLAEMKIANPLNDIMHQVFRNRQIGR